MIHVRRLVFAFTLVVLASSSTLAAAEGRVDIVRPPVSDARLVSATARLVAELSAAGYEVGWVSGRPNEDGRAEVDGARSSPNSAATLSIRAGASGAAIEVWIADHVTNKTLVRRVDVASPTAEIAALRAFELLRASLLELELTQSPKAAAPAPATATEPPRASVALPKQAEVPRAWHVDAGFGVLPGHRGLGTALFPMLAVGRALPRSTFVGARVAGFTTTTTPATIAGSAELRQELATLHGGLFLPLFGARLRAGLLAGAGAYHLITRGRPTPPNAGRTDHVWSLAGTLGASLEAGLSASSSAFVSGETVALLPAPAVRVGGDTYGGQHGVALVTAGFRAAL